jgi:hypothetical protein
VQEKEEVAGRASRACLYRARVTSVAELDLDLDVFQGPFDLLLAARLLW